MRCLLKNRFNVMSSIWWIFEKRLDRQLKRARLSPDRRIGCLDQMGLRFGLCVRLADFVAFERQPIAGIGIGIDVAEVSDRLLCQFVDRNRATDTIVPDMIGDDPAKPPAKRRPD